MQLTSSRGLLGAMLLVPAALHAQTVRGVLVDAGNVPVPGAVVLLMDSSASVRARVLSNERGEFRLTAPRAGHYRLRTMRIGFRPFTSSSVELRDGEETRQRLVLANVQLSLDTVRVVSKNVCRVDRDSAATTFAVWEQVRTALDAALLTGSEHNVQATLVSYDRHLDRFGRTVIGQTMSVGTNYAAQPWHSLSPDSLHRAGYVADHGTVSTIYHAPSLEVLLSDVFLADHCFHLTSGRDKRLLGIAFKPSSARTQTAELSGTLWLDRASSQLRKLEFHYENIMVEQQVESGGEMEFVALSNGSWVISKWHIRMPVLERVVRPQALGGLQLLISQIQVAGGELALATRGLDTLWARTPLVLTGDVVDSLTGKPVRGATASLNGTALEGHTDVDGHFSIPGVLPGNYTLEVRTPSLDSISTAHQSIVEFTDGKQPVRVRVPASTSILNSVCGRTIADGAGIVTGMVTVRGGAALPGGVRVVAEWNEEWSGKDSLRQAPRYQTTSVNSRGVYRLCGMPTNANVLIQPEVEETSPGSAQPVTVYLSPGSRIARADLVIDSVLVRGATFAGVVYGDTAKLPVGDAEVVFPDLARHATTNERGEFRLRDIPAGTHRVMVRRIGYGPVDTRLAFVANRTVDRNIYLSRVTMIDSVVVTADRPERWRTLFEENRTMGFGQFLTREQLEKKESQTLMSVVTELRSTRVAMGTSNHSWITGSRGSHDIFTPTAPIDLWHAAKPACYSDVYLDNLKIFSGLRREPLFDLSSISPSQIEAIEFYADGMQLPRNYSTHRDCGVLVIHSRTTYNKEK